MIIDTQTQSQRCALGRKQHTNLSLSASILLNFLLSPFVTAAVSCCSFRILYDVHVNRAMLTITRTIMIR